MSTTEEPTTIEAFFERPILNSPYERPTQHWELDETGQPTQRVIPERRNADFVTPIPKPKKRKKDKQGEEQQVILADDDGISTQAQQYDPTEIINEVRAFVEAWRGLPNPNDWQVTPETARLLQHWRHHRFSYPRPFFCQIEAVETVIWLTEVAPHAGKRAKLVLDHLANANNDANPELMRAALKLATGAGKTTVMAMLIMKQGISNPLLPVSARSRRPWKQPASPTTCDESGPRRDRHLVVGRFARLRGCRTFHRVSNLMCASAPSASMIPVRLRTRPPREVASSSKDGCGSMWVVRRQLAGLRKNLGWQVFGGGHHVRSFSAVVRRRWLAVGSTSRNCGRFDHPCEPAKVTGATISASSRLAPTRVEIISAPSASLMRASTIGRCSVYCSECVRRRME